MNTPSKAEVPPSLSKSLLTSESSSPSSAGTAGEPSRGYGPCEATPRAELERQIMSSLVPKNEREHWAAREIEKLRDSLRQAEAERDAEKNLHGQTRVVVEELNTICNDLRNAGQPQFIRSEAIRLLREDQAELRGQLTALQASRDALVKERDGLVGDNREMRTMLYVANSGMRGYHDDGELQDTSARPFIDFKRDSIADIQAKFLERNTEALRAARASTGQTGGRK